MKRWKLTLLGFICLVIAAVVGGVAFHFIESSYEDKVAAATWIQLNNLLANKSCINVSSLRSLSAILALESVAGIRIGPSLQNPVENISDWKLESTIFLAFQTLGAGGFGSAAPRTTGGKVFCVFFVLIGIPLFAVSAFGVGQLLSVWTNLLRNLFYNRVLHRQPPSENSTFGALSNFLILFISGFIIFILIPAAIFKALEDLTYGEAVFSAIMTTLTIGFIDFFPGADAPASYRSVYRILVGIWIILDLYWFSGVLFTLEDLFDFSAEVSKPLDDAIREENEADNGGQQEIKVSKKWKKKHFDKQWKKRKNTESQKETNSRAIPPTSGQIAAISYTDVVPVYSPNQIYPVLRHLADGNQQTSAMPSNISQVVIGS